MGLIYSTDIVTLDDVTITNYSCSELDEHEKENVLELTNLQRDWRCDDLDVGSGMYIDHGSGGADIVAIALLDVNFDHVRIYGSDDTISWLDSADTATGLLPVSLNHFINRYNIYVDLSSFGNYEYHLITTPAAANAVGRYTTTWKIGSVVMCYSVTELSTGIAQNTPRAEQSRSVRTLANGRRRVRKLGNLWRFEDIIDFPAGSETDREEILDLFTADDLDPGLLLYYNDGDTSEVYFGTKDASFQTEYIFNDVYRPSPFKFIEYI